MEQKTKRRIELMCIVALLFMMLPSADYLAKKAFALSFDTITLTGGTGCATNNGAIAINGITTAQTIWQICNGTLDAWDGESPYTFIAENTDPTGSTGFFLLGGFGFSSNYVLLADTLTNTDIRKYTLVGSTISLTGTFDPSSCTMNVNKPVAYDQSGFVWFTCAGEDNIGKFNPSTMTQTSRSGSLNAGINACDIPEYIGVDSSQDIGFVWCSGATDRLVSFRASTFALLSSVATTAGASVDYMSVDAVANRVIIVGDGSAGALGADSYTYNPTTGIMTLENNGVGDADGYLNCQLDTWNINTASRTMACVGTVAPASVDIFTSNSTGFFQQANIPFANSGSGDCNISTPPTHIVCSNGATASNIIIRITGFPFSDSPEDPNQGDDDLDDDEPNNQINGVCGNTDINGDGKVNVIDCTGGNSAWSGFNSGQNVTDTMANITDGLGFTNCGEDGDPETCGSGLFLFIVILLLVEFGVLAGYLGLTTKLHADKQVVDVALILLIAGFAVVALGFYLNWIPDLVFYSIIVIIAGFLVFGLIQRIKGG